MKEIVQRFVARINAHDVESLCGLMSEDHVFKDSLGRVVRGREAVRQGWAGYLAWFPDYEMTVTEQFEKDDVVVLFGHASGTFAVNGQLAPENHWKIPAAWRAVVRDGQIAEWQVYADNSPVLRIMEAHQD